MKVVINVCYGGFGLSNKAVKRCLELGMKETTYNKQGNYTDETADFVKSEKKYYAKNSHLESFRANPIVVQVVEQMGDKANGDFAKLKVIDIPFDSIEGWHIDEYDGWESICENHRSWS